MNGQPTNFGIMVIRVNPILDLFTDQLIRDGEELKDLLKSFTATLTMYYQFRDQPDICPLFEKYLHRYKFNPEHEAQLNLELSQEYYKDLNLLSDTILANLGNRTLVLACAIRVNNLYYLKVYYDKGLS